jgi:TfoX/Sxy family transcriptional regulator of competence genes
MATDPDFAAWTAELLAGAGPVTARKMFGEYGLFLDGKCVALVCDGRVFVKPWPAVLALVDSPALAPPYPGAKDHVVLEAELDDPELMVRLIRAVWDAMPVPKPRKRA